MNTTATQPSLPLLTRAAQYEERLARSAKVVKPITELDVLCAHFEHDNCSLAEIRRKMGWQDRIQEVWNIVHRLITAKKLRRVKNQIPRTVVHRLMASGRDEVLAYQRKLRKQQERTVSLPPVKKVVTPPLVKKAVTPPTKRPPGTPTHLDLFLAISADGARTRFRKLISQRGWNIGKVHRYIRNNADFLRNKGYIAPDHPGNGCTYHVTLKGETWRLQEEARLANCAEEQIIQEKTARGESIRLSRYLADYVPADVA
jgi:hypothetical protein